MRSAAVTLPGPSSTSTIAISPWREHFGLSWVIEAAKSAELLDVRALKSGQRNRLNCPF
jgi:hypothetical protein